MSASIFWGRVHDAFGVGEEEDLPRVSFVDSEEVGAESIAKPLTPSDGPSSSSSITTEDWVWELLLRAFGGGEEEDPGRSRSAVLKVSASESEDEDDEESDLKGVLD